MSKWETRLRESHIEVLRDGKRVCVVDSMEPGDPPETDITMGETIVRALEALELFDEWDRVRRERDTVGGTVVD